MKMIKASLRLILAALAATAALAACTKEIAPGQVDTAPKAPATAGSRVIAVSFAPQTKTTLGEDGLTPKFIGKEMIKVSNGTECKDCEVKVDDEGNATFSTDLEGPLKAVYPSTAAKMNGSEIEGVLVSSVQSGTFASANICMAENITDKAVFENKTAVLRFYVGSEIEVTSITLESLSESFAPNIGIKITVNAPAGKTLYDQMPDNQDRRVCYVAVPHGEFSQLTITTTAETQTPEAKMLTNCNLAAGSMYTVFIPYYIEVNDQKWAYCNIGAFLPEEPGYCFSWGNTTGYVYDAANKNWIVAPGYDGAGDSYSFSNANYDKTTGHSLTSDIPVNAQYDAATAAWGNSWRMPKCQEFKDLKGKTNAAIETGKGVTFNNTSLFFPEFGAGLDSGQSSYTAYSSSTWYQTEPEKARYFYFTNSYLSAEQTIGRRIGSLIRPIYGSAPESTVEDLTVKGEDTDNWQ